MTDHRGIKAQLGDLRDGLFGVFRELLRIARADYERERGPVGDSGALVQLLVHHEAFAWLRPVTELAARADELARKEEVAPAELEALACAADELLTPDPATSFGLQYIDALRSSMDVLFTHAVALRASRARSGCPRD